MIYYILDIGKWFTDIVDLPIPENKPINRYQSLEMIFRYK